VIAIFDYLVPFYISLFLQYVEDPDFHIRFRTGQFVQPRHVGVPDSGQQISDGIGHAHLKILACFILDRDWRSQVLPACLCDTRQ
jgi:hypothetical protein